MYIEGSMDFGTPTITNSNTATISPNVHNAGASKKLFGGVSGTKLFYSFKVSGDATGYELKLVGASDAALTSSVEVIASTGSVTTDKFGDALGSGEQTVEGFLELSGQKAAKQYYGLFLALAGTNPDATAGKACVVLDAQTGMLAPQAAVPST